MKALRLAPLLALLSLSSCSMLGLTRPVDVDHAHIETEHGVIYENIIVGKGAAVEVGQTIRIDYVAFLSDGQQFDSSIERGVPIEIVFGQAPIAGWNEGIAGMQAGGKRRMEIPPELAYGEAGVPGLVPENEVLTFEIELLEILSDAE